MPPLPVICGRECVRVLMLIGFALDRQRCGHITMRREQPPPTRTVVVPDHREIDRGTLRSLIRQTRMSVDEFVSLLDWIKAKQLSFMKGLFVQYDLPNS